MPSAMPVFNLRLREETLAAIKERAALLRRSATSIAQEFIEKGLAADKDPLDVPPSLLSRLKTCAEYYGRDPDGLLVEALKDGILQMEQHIEHERSMEREGKIWDLNLSDEELDSVAKFVNGLRATQKRPAPAKKITKKK